MPETFKEYVDPFISFLKFEKRFSQHTVLAYGTDLQEFNLFLLRVYDGVPFTGLNYQHVRSWLADLKENKLTAKSINRKISTLKSFFKYHLKTGSIQANPMAKIIAPKISRKLPVFVKEADVATLKSSVAAATESWKTLN